MSPGPMGVGHGDDEHALFSLGGYEPDPTGVPPDRAFGKTNRARLLSIYFDRFAEVPSNDAWQHVYRLLLWINRTIGLAHCYESDKCQPGRPWYARSLAFHYWLASEFGVPVDELGDHIDLLFRHAAADLARYAASRREAKVAAAARQRRAYPSEMPEPGEDPELQAIIRDVLDGYLTIDPPPSALRELTERIRAHIGQENKRKNLVGEGFEDTVAALLRHMPGVTSRHEVLVRPLLHELPGFNLPRGAEKARKVDMALLQRSDGHRTLVSCKWSIRSDREEQFVSDFRSYTQLEAAGQDFSYVLITNEFDPARLAAACEARRENALLFTHVVHVNPEGPSTTYRVLAARRNQDGQARAEEHIARGRLMSLARWMSELQH